MTTKKTASTKKKVSPKKKTAKKKIGRPTKYTKALAAKLCAQISDGKSMRTICKSDKMPGMTTVFMWLQNNDEFLKQYEIAKQEQAEAMIEDMVDISDNVGQPALDDKGKPILVNGEPIIVASPVDVNHAKLRVDTRKWVASKLKPKKYGDKVQQEITGKNGEDLNWSVTVVKSDHADNKA